MLKFAFYKLKKYFMRFIFLLIFIFNALVFYGQNVVISMSLQKIYVNSDGSYYIIEKTKKKENPQDTIAQNPFEIPSEYVHPDPSEWNKMNDLVNVAKQIEAFYCVENFKMGQSITKSNLALSHAKHQKNKYDVTAEKGNLKILKKELKFQEKKYKESHQWLEKAKKMLKSSDLGAAKDRINLTRYVKSNLHLINVPHKNILDVDKIEKIDDITPANQISKENVGELTITPSPKKVEKINNFEVEPCLINKSEQKNVNFYSHQYIYILSYTPIRLRSHLKDKSFMDINASIAKSDNQFYLNLDIVFKSKDAPKTYGYVAEGDLLRVEFVNGMRISLKSLANSYGALEEYTGHAIYKTSYLIDKEALKYLENIPIDKVGILWSSGYEGYVVYEVDVLMKQINCLKKSK